MKQKKTSQSEQSEPQVLAEDLTQEKADITSAEELIAIAETKVKEYKDMAQRIQAEFDNYRKRNAESVRISRQEGISEVVSELLPIVDTFERALAIITDESSKNGVNLILKQTLSLLSKYDIIEIPALGAEFDPTLHNAVLQTEDPENANKVVEVLQKGYTRNNKVIRYSMVKVAN